MSEEVLGKNKTSGHSFIKCQQLINSANVNKELIGDSMYA